MDPASYEAFRRLPVERNDWDEATRHLNTVRQLSATLHDFSAEKEEEAKAAINALANSPKLRNCLMSWPPNSDNPPSIEFIMKFFCGALSRHPIDLTAVTSFHQFKKLSQEAIRCRERDRGADLVQLFNEREMMYILPAIAPSLTRLTFAFSNPRFLKGLLGDGKQNSNLTISANLLFQRIKCAEAKYTDDGLYSFDPDLGKAWETSILIAHPYILEKEKEWVHHLALLSQTNHLDILAGVEVPGDRYQAINQDYFSNQPRSHGSVEHIPLLLPNATLAGTASAWHTPLSPGFEAYAVEKGLPLLNFMLDPHGGKERYINIESPNAIKDETPVFLQVGSCPKAKVYKAQECTTFGRDIITIMNFIGKERERFIHGRLTEDFGQDIASNWTPKTRRIDMLVHAVITKSGGYGAHHDGKHMLCDDALEGHARRDMWVPTLVFQNSDKKLASLVFTDQETGLAKEGIPQEINCRRCTLHEQGSGIQDSLLHAVVIDSKAPINYFRWGISGRHTQDLQASGLLALRLAQKQDLPIVKCSRSHAVKLQWNKEDEPLCAQFRSLQLAEGDHDYDSDSSD